MFVVLFRRRTPVASFALHVLNRWFTWGHSVFRRVRARHDLTPQERANLLASYTPPALITASLGGHVG